MAAGNEPSHRGAVDDGLAEFRGQGFGIDPFGQAQSHDERFVRRLLSALPADRRLRILTSDSEFHSFRRQIARLEEDGLVAVERIAAEPFASFADRFAAAVRRGGYDLVFVSQVFFNSAATSGSLDDIAAAVADPHTLIAFDGYHGFMALPTATTSYVMARAMGGDAPLMAALTTTEHLLAVLTLPLWIALLGLGGQ